MPKAKSAAVKSGHQTKAEKAARLDAEEQLRGDAVDTLCQMGLGALAGVRSCRWMQQNSGAYTYEQVVNGKAYLGLSQARASAVISSTDTKI